MHEIQRGDLTPGRLRRGRTSFGTVLETFVHSELRKLASWADDRYAFSHFPDKERNEVDIVIGDGCERVGSDQARCVRER